MASTAHESEKINTFVEAEILYHAESEQEVSTNPQKIEYNIDSECGHRVEDDDNDTLTFMRAVTTPSGWAVRVKFFRKVLKTQIHLIEALCFTKWDWWNVFGILYDMYFWEACSENINILTHETQNCFSWTHDRIPGGNPP